MDAIRAISLFTAGALARALPSTSTSAICMEKANRFQAPSPHALTMSMGPEPVAGMAARNTMTVRMMQKMNGSGKNRFTRWTHPFDIFLNI